MRLSLRCLLALSLAGCGGSGSSTSQTSAPLTVCASGGTLEGLDVSKYEGAIDWTAVKNSGKAFAIARISDGLNYPDAYFDSNWSAMKSVGLVRGSYQYFEPAQDPVAQANMVLQHIGTLGAGDLSPVIDVETMGGLSASAVMAAVDQWLSTIESATGRTPIVYADPSFWSGLGDPAVNADLWIANWGVSCPDVPGAWSGWRFWQYSATGSVSGVSGGVDVDRFNGTLADLLAYAGGGTTPPPPLSTAITAPADGATVSGTVTVSATASAGATKVELYVDGALLATASSASWDTTTASDGAHSLTSKAYDASGASATSAAVSVIVSNAAPPPLSTAITAPADGSTVSGTVTVSATASAGATKVELYVDGALLATASSASWDTTTASDGAHALTSKAYDASGASATSAAVNVTVSNAASCPPGTVNVGGSCVPSGGGCNSTSGGGLAGGFAGLALVCGALERRRRRPL